MSCEKSIKIAISAGDPAGIGPEITVKALLEYFRNIRNDLDFCPFDIEFIVITKEGVLERLPFYYDGIFKDLPIRMKHVSSEYAIPDYGDNSKAGGDISFKAVQQGIDLCLSGETMAIVTAPISKKSWNMAGYNYTGHTELLAEKSGSKDYAMAFISDNYRVILNSTHLPISRVPSSITHEHILQKIRLAQDFLNKNNINEPVHVLGLNPHAGENGLIGSEESEISKAISIAQNDGINCHGPLVPDAFFRNWLEKPDGFVVAMYHDQGLIPFKMATNNDGVNITLGLSFIRTSPDHGTAFDIAGKNIAETASMLSAIKLAISIIDHN